MLKRFYKPLGRIQPVKIPANQYEYFKQPKDPRYPRYYYWVAGLGLGAVSYYYAHLETVPISGRRRFMDVSPQMESMISKQAYHQIMHQYRHKLLPSFHPNTLFVKKVAYKLIKASGLSNMNWEIHVIQDGQVNAFVLPGGKIFVFSGLIPVVQTEDGMAAVLGHEMAHQIARHSAEKLSFSRVVMLLRLALSAFFDPGLLFSRMFTEFGLLMPFSRKCESEADYIGLLLMAKACYDPNAAVDVWRRMKMVDKNNRIPEYISTHPSHDTRIDSIKGWLNEAQQQRTNAGCDEYFSFKRFI